MQIKIAPSILSADFSNLAQQIKLIENQADMIHIDVMDGHFVPQITYGQLIVKTMKKITSLPLDVHLMISNPEKYIDSFAKAGADIITIHQETTDQLPQLIQQIKKHNIKASVALNPATPLSTIEPLLNSLDMVLLMTVNPGFAGQSFISSVLDKIKKLRQLKPNLDIQVDGGISLETIKEPVNAGANILVAGSAIFSTEDPKQAITDLKAKVLNK